MPPAIPPTFTGDRLHLRVFQALEITMESGIWFTPNVRTSFWRFYWNYGDGGWLDYAGGSLHLEAERPYFVPADVLFTCRNALPLRHFYVHFDVLGLPAPLRRELFGTPVTLRDNGALETQVRSLGARLAVRPAGLVEQCEIKALLYTALALAFGQIPDRTYQKYLQFAAAGEVVQPALRAIETEPGTSLANAELAALCHLSEDHFIRRFRECTGQTPAAYVQEYRVQTAAQMLLFTTQSIDAIAATTGFPNRFYFSRVFARHFGISPAAYRKAARSDG